MGEIETAFAKIEQCGRSAAIVVEPVLAAANQELAVDSSLVAEIFNTPGTQKICGQLVHRDMVTAWGKVYMKF